MVAMNDKDWCGNVEVWVSEIDSFEIWEVDRLV